MDAGHRVMSHDSSFHNPPTRTRASTVRDSRRPLRRARESVANAPPRRMARLRASRDRAHRATRDMAREATAATAATAAERAFRAKYGDELRPKPRLIATDVKHFDSADWAMRKSAEEARRRDGGGTAATRSEGRAMGEGTTEDSAREPDERGAREGDATSTREGDGGASEGADG